MSDTYQTETRTTDDGVEYRIEWFYDYDTTPSWLEEDSGHGVIHELMLDPAEFAETWDEENDGPMEMEEAIRHKMMRPLENGFRNGWQRHSMKYYDVWETMKRAKAEGWSVPNPVGLTPDDRAMEAIEKDFQHIRGWYQDDWHYCGIEITVINTGATASLWGIEDNDDDYLEEVIRELLRDARACKTNDNQLEINL